MLRLPDNQRGFEIQSPLVFRKRKDEMCDILDDQDYTKLETYLVERPNYAGIRRNAYADWALEELTIDILSEWSRRKDVEFGERDTPTVRIINKFIQRMRRFRKIAPVGKRLMFTIAIKEAEGLKAIFC